MKFIRSDLSARSVALNTRARSSGLCRAVPGDCHFQGCREGWEEAGTQHSAQPQARTEPQRCPATKINLLSPSVVAEDVRAAQDRLCLIPGCSARPCAGLGASGGCRKTSPCLPQRLDSIMSEIFSSLNNSVILSASCLQTSDKCFM